MSDPRPEPDDFVAQWRSAEDVSSTLTPSAELDARLRRRLEARERPRPLIAGTLAAAVAVGLYLRPTSPVPAEPAQTQVLFSSRACAPSKVTSNLSLPAGCGLELPASGVTLTALEAAELVHTEAGVRLRRGRVRIEVEGPTPRPFIVLTARGRIEAASAGFTLDARGGAGQVSLHTGQVRLLADDAPARTLGAGDRVRWPPALSAQALDRAVAEISRLRDQGRARAAVARLDALLAAPLDDETAEVLSYERGLVLEDDLAAAEAACAHWHAHAARFERGRYRAEVDKRKRACGGNSDGPGR